MNILHTVMNWHSNKKLSHHFSFWLLVIERYAVYFVSKFECTNQQSYERGGTKYPQTGGTGENTPLAVQSRKKKRDNGNNMEPG